MMQSCMHRTGIYQKRHCHLMYSSHPLIIRMRYNCINKFIVYGNKTIYGIIDYFSERHSMLKMLKCLRSYAKVVFGTGISYICNTAYLINKRTIFLKYFTPQKKF